MGYSHYWRRVRPVSNADKLRHREAFRLLTRDAWRLFAYCEDHGLALAGPLGDGTPETTAERIAFNGPAPCDYETCDFPAVVPSHYYGDGGAAFEFCKTALRPYDRAVVAFLLLAKWHYGDAVHLSSDGDAVELMPGADLLRRALPHLPAPASSLDAFGALNYGGGVAVPCSHAAS